MEQNEVMNELNRIADECIANITSAGQQKLRDIFIAGYVNGATSVNYLQCEDCPKNAKRIHTNIFDFKRDLYDTGEAIIKLKNKYL